MTMTIRARFDGKGSVPDDPVDVAAGESVKLHIERVSLTAFSASDALLATGPHRELDGSDELHAAGLELHRRREDKGWSLTDCISFVGMARQQTSRALTHDHHFEQAGFEALLRSDP